MGMNNFIHENKPGLCVIGIILGVPSVIISVFAMLYEAEDTGLMLWSHELMGNWAFWFFIIGLILLVPSIYYLVTFVRQLREFRELMKTDSKALFIKNQDRIEELAWRLHPDFERMVIDKKAKLKVK